MVELSRPATAWTLKIKIYLIRHARPEFENNTRICRLEFAGAIRRYNEAGLVMPPDPIDLGMSVSRVFASDLRRCIDSASHFFPDSEVVVDALFREAELPPRLPLWIPCRFTHAAIVARLAWLCGYAKGVESFRDARKRAASAASKLADEARRKDVAVLVAHGFINHLIGGCLAGSGWAERPGSGRGYGSISEFFRKPEVS